MKIVHTSDWHLGKKLFRSSRLEEQTLFLDWLYNHLLTNNVDAIIVAGDIFDTPFPPTDALKLYFDFLKRVSDQKIYIYIISGNHDSGKFLEAPKSILDSEFINVTGIISDDITNNSFQIKNNHEQIDILMLPYFRSHEINNLLEYNADQNEDENESQILNKLEQWFRTFQAKGSTYRILVAHHLFGNYEPSGSELELSLSGIDSIPPRLLKEYFDYVALGHIHGKQVISKETPSVIYPGSPIPFRFSERMDKYIVTIDTQKNDWEFNLVPTFRRLYNIECNEKNLEETIAALENKKDTELRPFLNVFYQQERPEIGVADKIRELIRPKDIDLMSMQINLTKDQEKVKSEDLTKGLPNLTDLFDQFYNEKYGVSTPKEILSDFKELIVSINSNETEEHLQ